VHDLLILGAGAAGLQASRLARRAGKRTLTLEARDRLGGRMWTARGGSEAFALELGAEYVHGEAPVTQRLARELGLSFVEVADRHFRLRRGRWVDGGDYWERLGRVFSRIPAGGDRSFLEHARERLRGRAALEAVSFVESFHGAPAGDISALSLRQPPEEFESSGRARRILGGYGALVDKLAAGGGPVARRTVVERVRWRPGNVEVTARTPSGRKTFRARRLLVTLPVGVLKARAVLFEPEPRAAWRALDGIGMGDALRLTARLRGPIATMPPVAFWHDEKGELPVWWSPGPEESPLVTAWCGGPRARRLLEGGLAGAKALAEKSLLRLARRRGARFHAHDWRRDPFARGAYSYHRVGALGAAEKLARPLARTLIFAGEACAPRGEHATVEGALASAERAITLALR